MIFNKLCDPDLVESSSNQVSGGTTHKYVPVGCLPAIYVKSKTS